MNELKMALLELEIMRDSFLSLRKDQITTDEVIEMEHGFMESYLKLDQYLRNLEIFNLKADYGPEESGNEPGRGIEG